MRGASRPKTEARGKGGGGRKAAAWLNMRGTKGVGPSEATHCYQSSAFAAGRRTLAIKTARQLPQYPIVS
jgi:hypothetical protein